MNKHPLANLGFQTQAAEINNHPLADLGFTPEASTQAPEQPSMLESGLRGAAQSATFGFADELAGAGEAATDVLNPNNEQAKLQDFLNLYKQHRDESRKAYEAAEEANPMSYLGGELVGGLAPGFGAAEAGIAGGKTLGQIIRRGIGTGALAGATYGAGTSGADLTKVGQPGAAPVSELAGDVAKGALAGGVTGGLLPTITEGIPTLAKSFANKSGFARDVAESAKRGYAGEELVGHEARRATEQSVNDLAEDLDQQLSKEIDKGRQLKAQGGELAAEQGMTSDISDILQKYKDKAESFDAISPQEKADQAKFINHIDSILEERNPEQTGFEQLQRTMGSFKPNTNLGEKTYQTNEITHNATELNKELRGAQRGEDFGEAGELAQRGDAVMAAGLKARELLFPQMQGLTDPQQIMMQKRLSETIRKLESDTGAAASARFVVDKALEDLSSINPNLTDQMKQRIMDRATAYDIARKIGAQSAIQGHLLSTVQGAALGGANIAGGVAKDMKSFISGATPDILKDIIGSLTQKGSPPRDLIEKLNTAVGSDGKRRNAILFAIMQNPGYRQALGVTPNE